MKNTILAGLLFLYVGFLSTGCQLKKEPVANKPTALPVVNIEYKQCQDPRSKMCTREFRPVCATRDTGIRCVTTPCPSTEKVTKPNACVACGDDKVFGFTEGACN